MANTIDRKINPEIPIVQESNRNEVYVPNASYTEPGVAGFFKTHFIVDDNGIVHLRKEPKRAVSAVTYDSDTNTLIITFDDGTVQNIKLNDCACVDGVDLIVYDAFNVITFKETSWDTLDVGKVLVVSAAMTSYDNDEIIAQLDKYNVVTTNIGDKSITSNYQTDVEYQIYKCTDGSLVIFATEAFAGRFIILKREFAVQKNVANITYDDATGMLTIYYVTGDPVTLPIKFNPEPGTGEGAVQQIGAKATGKQAAAFGGLRYDKQTGRTPTSAEGNQSFAAGGSVHAEGDFSAVFGKDTIARQRASFAAGSSTAGMTEEEFNAFYWDSTNNTGLHGGSKNSDGEICDFTGAPYAKSFAFAAALGCDTQAKGARSFTAGDNTAATNTGATAIGMNTKASGTAASAEGYKTEASGEHSHAGGGQFTQAKGLDSFAHGANAEARADRSVAFGYETIAASENGMAIGKQNVVRTDALFQVGNGTDYNNRRDAFAVLKDGRVKVQTAPVDDDDVIRKADLGYEIDFPHGEPTVRCDNTDGITVTGTMRIYFNQAKTVFRDVPNVSVEIPIFAGKNVTIDADETNKKAVVKVSDMGSYGVDIGVGLPTSATNGVLTVEQLALLQSSENNYIMFQHEKYYLEDKGHVEGYITYTHTGYENSTYWIKSITITISTRAWVLNKVGLAGQGLEIGTDGVLKLKLGTNLSFGTNGEVNAQGGSSVDVNTLLALLSSGNGITVVNDIANDKAQINVDPRFIQFDVSTLDINPMGEASEVYITDDPNTGYYEFTNDHAGEIRYNANSSNDTVVLQSGTKGNVKTLFGNQSIYGSGNIDLYRHIVWIKNDTSGKQIYITVQIISSSNTPIDSLTDLFTVLSSFANAWYPCNGRVNMNSTDRGVAYNFNARATSSGAVAFLKQDGTEGYYVWADNSSGLTVSDTVTTV